MDKDWNWKQRINVDPRVLGGKPVIKGTRVPVQVVVGVLAGGATPEDVARDYLITEEDVRAALAYAAAAVARERAGALPR